MQAATELSVFPWPEVALTLGPNLCWQTAPRSWRLYGKKDNEGQGQRRTRTTKDKDNEGQGQRRTRTTKDKNNEGQGQRRTRTTKDKDNPKDNQCHLTLYSSDNILQ